MTDVDSLVWFVFPIFGTPIMIGLAWWLWSRLSVARPHPWRRRVQLVSLFGASINAVIYYSWFAYRALEGNSPATWQLKGTLADNIGIYLAVFTIAAGLLSAGGVRIVVVVCGVMAVLLWSNLGLL